VICVAALRLWRLSRPEISDMAFTKNIGECFLFEVAILGTLEVGPMGVGWGVINMASGV
jgi:hypothetical protein